MEYISEDLILPSTLDTNSKDLWYFSLTGPTHLTIRSSQLIKLFEFPRVKFFLISVMELVKYKGKISFNESKSFDKFLIPNNRDVMCWSSEGWILMEQKVLSLGGHEARRHPVKWIPGEITQWAVGFIFYHCMPKFTSIISKFWFLYYSKFHTWHSSLQ